MDPANSEAQRKLQASLYTATQVDAKAIGSPLAEAIQPEDPELAHSLHTAIRDQNTPEVQRLLAKGALVNSKIGGIPLAEALRHGNPIIISTLLTAGAHLTGISTKTSRWMRTTALEDAVLKGHYDAVKLVLDHSVTKEAKFNQEYLNTLLHQALTTMLLPMITLIFDHGGAIDPSVPMDKEDPQATWLHRAAGWDGNEDVLCVLLEKGMCEVNQQRGDGQTALHLACTMGWERGVEGLMGKGADWGVRDQWGEMVGEKTEGWLGLEHIREVFKRWGAEEDEEGAEEMVEDEMAALQSSVEVIEIQGVENEVVDAVDMGLLQEQTRDTLVYQEVIQRLTSDTVNGHTPQEEKPQFPKRLIDIYTGDLVPGTEDKPYIVVSYIWSPEQYQTRDPRHWGSSHQSLTPGYFDEAVDSLLVSHPSFVSRLDPLPPNVSFPSASVLPLSAYSIEVYTLAAQEAHRRNIRYIWIDAHCIDQTSSTDKQTEIPHMAEYYASAACCVVVSELMRQKLCVGTANNWHIDGSRPAAREKKGNRWLMPEETLVAWIIGYHHHRVWTFQETFLARDIVVCGAGVRIDATAFVRQSQEEHRKNAEFGRERFEVLGTTFPTQTVRLEAGWGSLTLAHCLQLLEGRSCYLPHDKIYGILGLLPGKLRRTVPVDYEVSLGAALVNYLLVSICSGELVNLFMLQAADQPAHGIANAPSWLPGGYGAPFEGVVNAALHDGLDFVADAAQGSLGLTMQYLHIAGVRIRGDGKEGGKEVRWGGHNTLVRLLDCEGRAMPFLVPVGVEPLEFPRRRGTAAEVKKLEEEAFFISEATRRVIQRAVMTHSAVLATFGIRKLTEKYGSRPDVWLWLVLCTSDGGVTWRREGVGITKDLKYEMKKRRFDIR